MPGRYLYPRFYSSVWDGGAVHFRYGYTRLTAHLRGIAAAMRYGGCVRTVRVYDN